MEAYVLRDADEIKTAPLQSDASGDGPFKQSLADCTNESGVIADYLEKLLSSPNQMITKNSSPKAKKHPLDLSPENFFMTSNEMNGKWRTSNHSFILIAIKFLYIKMKILSKLTKLVKSAHPSRIGIIRKAKKKEKNISQRELVLWLPLLARHHSLSSCSAMPI